MFTTSGLDQNVDHGQWEGIMADMMPLFLRVAHQILNDWHLAQDAVSEAFVKLYLKYHLFKGQSQFKTYGYRVLVNHCLDLRRKKERWWRVFDGSNNTEDVTPLKTLENPFSDMDSKERMKSLQDMLEALTPRQKVASILFFFEEMSLKETAYIMKISEGTVKALISQSRQVLKQKWEGGCHE